MSIIQHTIQVNSGTGNFPGKIGTVCFAWIQQEEEWREPKDASNEMWSSLKASDD